MARVLLVEDNYYMTELIKKKLDERGWKYDRANKVVAANTLFKENDYDCLIIDLMIDPLGLTNDEVNEYHPFFGWAWFQKLLSGDENVDIELKRKTIVFSQFVTDLRKSRWKNELKDIAIIAKGNDPELKELLKNVERVINKR